VERLSTRATAEDCPSLLKESTWLRYRTGSVCQAVSDGCGWQTGRRGTRDEERVGTQVRRE
jgi:hypothetical protein